MVHTLIEHQMIRFPSKKNDVHREYLLLFIYSVVFFIIILLLKRISYKGKN